MLGTGWGVLANLLQLLDPVYDEFCSACNGENGEHFAGCTAPQLHQVPVWPLDEDDQKKLGTATAAYLQTMPEKAKVRELLEKHLPLFVFCGTIGEVFGPRAKFSLEKKRKAHLAKLAQVNQNRFNRAGVVRPGSGTLGEGEGAKTTAQADARHDAHAGNQNNGEPFDWSVAS